MKVEFASWYPSTQILKHKFVEIEIFKVLGSHIALSALHLKKKKGKHSKTKVVVLNSAKYCSISCHSPCTFWLDQDMQLVNKTP